MELRTRVVLPVALALLAVPAAPAQAACVAPAISVTPAAATVGQTVTVTGRGWASACHDTGRLLPAPPETGIPLSLASAPGVLLGTVDADVDDAFTTQVVVPPGVPAGPTGIVVSVPATPSGTVHLASVPFAVVSSELPRTAAPVAATALLALVFLLAGAAAVLTGAATGR